LTAVADPQITTAVEEGCLLITLNRPERLNAWTAQMGEELREAFDRADRDDNVRGVVVTGAGRAFCAGADLGQGGATFDAEARADSSGAPAQEGGRWRDGGGQLVLRIFECKKPVVAAINGAAVGVGVTMTLPMDVRIASEEARFGFVFVRRGIIPEACSSWFLPRLVGIGQALEWVYSGKVFSAEEALAGGLVRSLHPPQQLLDEALRLIREFTAESAPVSVALSRQLLWRMLGAEHPMLAHRADSLGMYLRGRSADAREGIESFLEKRPARFPEKVSTDLPDLFEDWPAPPFAP